MHRTDGTTVTYSFSHKPRVTYEGEKLIMTTTEAMVEYPLASLHKLTFASVTDDAISVPLAINPSLTDGEQRIYDINGHLIRTVSAGQTLTTTGLPVGIYIVHNKNVSYKIRVFK